MKKPKTIKYIVKSYFLTHDCRVCTYDKKLAFRFDTHQEALGAIADFAPGKDEQPMVVEVVIEGK